jgi:hypothetical protein
VQALVRRHLLNSSPPVVDALARACHAIVMRPRRFAKRYRSGKCANHAIARHCEKPIDALTSTSATNFGGISFLNDSYHKSKADFSGPRAYIALHHQSEITKE